MLFWAQVGHGQGCPRRDRPGGPRAPRVRVGGSNAANTLTTGAGSDTILGRGGGDRIDAGSGDDPNINVKDGVADIVVCGPGNDPFTTAEYDPVDNLATDCERG